MSVSPSMMKAPNYSGCCLPPHEAFTKLSKVPRRALHRVPGIDQAWVMCVSPPQPGSHMLRPRSFPSPTKCLRCTSLMLGLGRQGLGCDGETLTHFTPLHTSLPRASHSP